MVMEFFIDLVVMRKNSINKYNNKYLFIYFDYRITFVVSAYRNCPDTNAKVLADSIERTLIEVKTSFMTSNL